MENDYQEEERYYQAQKRVKDIKGFYVHLTVYLLSNPIIIVVNLLTSPDFLYFLICLFGWGIPLALHGMLAFNYPTFFNKEWEERKIKELMEKENNSKWE